MRTRFFIFLIWVTGLILAAYGMDMRTFSGRAPEYRNLSFLLFTAHYIVWYISIIMWISIVPALWIFPIFSQIWTKAVAVFLLSMLLLKFVWDNPSRYETPLEISGLIVAIFILVIMSMIIAKMMHKIREDSFIGNEAQDEWE